MKPKSYIPKFWYTCPECGGEIYTECLMHWGLDSQKWEPNEQSTGLYSCIECDYETKWLSETKKLLVREDGKPPKFGVCRGREDEHFFLSAWVRLPNGDAMQWESPKAATDMAQAMEAEARKNGLAEVCYRAVELPPEEVK